MPYVQGHETSMTSAQSKGNVWTVTLTSAKEAVHLYFEPLFRISAWLLRVPGRLRAEHQRQQTQLAKRLDELEQQLELDRARKDAWTREQAWKQERAKALAQELKLKPDHALEMVSVLAEGGEEGLEKWWRQLKSELEMLESLGGKEQELEELRIRVQALRTRQGWKQAVEVLRAQIQERIPGVEESHVLKRLLEQVRTLSQELKRRPEHALANLIELEQSWRREQEGEWKQMQALPEQMPLRSGALRRIEILGRAINMLRAFVLMQARVQVLTSVQMLEKLGELERALEQAQMEALGLVPEHGVGEVRKDF